nr:MAG TPA: hypothetical protein [Caudoviricetes sp.]
MTLQVLSFDFLTLMKKSYLVLRNLKCFLY